MPEHRAALVGRHPATLRYLQQSAAVAGLELRQVIGPSFLPKSAKGDFDVVVLDLDLDPNAPPAELVGTVTAAVAETPVVVLAGLRPRQRLVDALAAPEVVSLGPEIGTWLEQGPKPQPVAQGAAEPELAVPLKRL